MGNLRRHFSNEFKEEIIHRIKNNGEKVKDISNQYGIREKLIYLWISKQYKDPSGNNLVLENSRLKRQNEELLRMIGKLTVDIEQSKKRAL